MAAMGGHHDGLFGDTLRVVSRSDAVLGVWASPGICRGGSLVANLRTEQPTATPRSVFARCTGPRSDGRTASLVANHLMPGAAWPAVLRRRSLHPADPEADRSSVGPVSTNSNTHASVSSRARRTQGLPCMLIPRRNPHSFHCPKVGLPSLIQRRQRPPANPTLTRSAAAPSPASPRTRSCPPAKRRAPPAVRPWPPGSGASPAPATSTRRPASPACP